MPVIRRDDAPTFELGAVRVRGGHRSRRFGEGEEERISLRVHLDSTLGGARLTDDAPMLG